MYTDIKEFQKAFSWYRELSKQLLLEIPEKYLYQEICPRSLKLVYQFIDLGEMQLRVLSRITGKEYDMTLPSAEKIDKQEIIAFMDTCSETFFQEISHLDKKTAQMDWFGRMQFDFGQALSFLLSHESMHHGEILSFVYDKDMPMPPAFKKTWGFDA